MNKLMQTGFALTEVLVAVLVLALGVIGAAGMQLSALRAHQQSGMQTAAIELATEMADKMRASKTLLAHSDDGNPYLKVDYQAGLGAPIVPSKFCYGASDCSSDDLA